MQCPVWYMCNKERTRVSRSGISRERRFFMTRRTCVLFAEVAGKNISGPKLCGGPNRNFIFRCYLWVTYCCCRPLRPVPKDAAPIGCLLGGALEMMESNLSLPRFGRKVKMLATLLFARWRCHTCLQRSNVSQTGDEVLQSVGKSEFNPCLAPCSACFWIRAMYSFSGSKMPSWFFTIFRASAQDLETMLNSEGIRR